MGSSKKANTYFQFKQFIVHQDQCAMKVGTDGVLLGAWTSTMPNDKILDIGTGTGLIALMLAQKDPSLQIRAVDINEDAVLQAKANVGLSLFRQQIIVEHICLSELNDSDRFDLIVSNPPYFRNSLQSSNEKRMLARHTDSLSLDLLFMKVSNILSTSGRFCMIYPIQEEDLVEQVAENNGLLVKKKTIVYPTSTSLPKRVLWEFQKANNIVSDLLTYNLIIEEDRHVYTQEFKALVENYYLD